MAFHRLSAILYTTELEKTIQFYKEKLGFVQIAFNKEWEWAKLEKDKIELMFSSPLEKKSFDHAVFTGSIYIYTKDIETWWTEIKTEVKICYPLETFQYGMKEFAIYDNNGYIIQFGEEIV